MGGVGASSDEMRCQGKGRTSGQLEKYVWSSEERSGLEAETGECVPVETAVAVTEVEDRG